MPDSCSFCVNIPDLTAQVARRVGSRIREFHIVATHHGVVLRGRAPSYHVKQLAQHAVMGATTTPIAANEIGVYNEDHADAR